MHLAHKLNDILVANESVSFQWDDAKAFAEGMRVLIDANTHHGNVDEPQLIEDMKFFMIDQGSNIPVGIIIQNVTQFQPSNAAANLYGWRRIGTIGWKKKYWDDGK